MTRTGGLVEVVQGKVAQGTSGTEQVEPGEASNRILSCQAQVQTLDQAPKLNYPAILILGTTHR
mgnify:CR=1 FL=1